MTNGKTESLLERACLLSYFITVIAFKENANWTAQQKIHSELWNASNLVAKGVLLFALTSSVLGAVIVVGRMFKFLFKKPNWNSMMIKFKKSLNEPYEPQPWMNLGYGLLGFLMMPSPFIDLVVGMILAGFFSVTARTVLTNSSVQKMIGFAS
jgi:hypothetical protein